MFLFLETQKILYSGNFAVTKFAIFQYLYRNTTALWLELALYQPASLSFLEMLGGIDAFVYDITLKQMHQFASEDLW